MRVLVTGATGMVGTALQNIEVSLKNDVVFIGSKDCDLMRANDTVEFFEHHKPTHVIHLAARVGGIKGNTDHIAEFYRDNILINTNVLEAARLCGVDKLVSMLSTCVYPDKARYPLTEDQVNDGPPHPSNFGYAYAKRMLDVQSRAYRQQYGCNFITAVPNNLFGENDNFHMTNSHVIPAMIRKVHETKIAKLPFVTFWGDGSPLREFTYSEDIATILYFLLEKYSGVDPVNVGNTAEVSIADLAYAIVDIMGYEGDVIWDKSMPMGQLRKPSSNQKLVGLGWSVDSYTPLKKGLSRVCEWFEKNQSIARGLN